MATLAQVTAHAKAWAQACDLLKAAHSLCQELSQYNGVNDPNWGALDSSFKTGDVVTGTEIVPGDVSNAIGSVNNFLAFWDGTSRPAQSAWGNNVEKLAKPITSRPLA